MYDDVERTIGGDMFLYSPDTSTHFPHSGATPSTIDLVLAKGYPSPADFVTDPCLSSDHVPVFFTVIGDVYLADIPHLVVKDYVSAD